MTYELKNGAIIENDKQARIMQWLIDEHPQICSDYPYSDTGMAQLFMDIFCDNLRYCPENKHWYKWEGYWHGKADKSSATEQLIELLSLLRLYADEIELDEKHPYREYIKIMMSTNKIKNIISLVELQSGSMISASEFDKNPYILNTPTSAIDLRDGSVVSHDDLRKYAVTKRTVSRNFIEGLDSRCERWYQFIDQIMNGDKQKIAFLQRALGYSILGDNTEECMFMAYGSTTRNGKGTLFSTIGAVLGHDYSSVVSPKMICELRQGVSQDYNAAQPALAKLVGTRFVSMSESPKDARLDAASMKALTGRDELMTRQLYGSPFEFIPQFTMWMNTNYLPAINDTTVFSSKRIWVIEFNRHFEDWEQDKTLKSYFTDPANTPTILAWLIEGCKDYLNGGLRVPQCVKDATDKYEKSQDRIGRFIDECCEECDFENGDLRGTIYSAYTAWCHNPENRFQPMGSTSFYNEMSGRGYHIKHTATGYIMSGLKQRVPEKGKVKLT